MSEEEEDTFNFLEWLAARRGHLNKSGFGKKTEEVETKLPIPKIVEITVQGQVEIEYVNTIDYQPSSKLVQTKKGKDRRRL